MEQKYLIAALYKFVSFPDYASRRSEILKFCIEKSIKGTLLVAEEGINGTIAGRKTNIYKFIQFLKTKHSAILLKEQEDTNQMLKLKILFFLIVK